MSRVDTEHAVQNWLMYQIDSILLKTKGPKIKLDLYFLYIISIEMGQKNL